jgi:endonuclease/exonuclease/phosphatase (EEP) superfamily protein YafD
MGRATVIPMGSTTTTGNQGPTNKASKDPWMQYRKGLKSLVSVYTGKAGKGEDEYTLEAALTGWMLGLLGVNTAILASIEATRGAAVIAMLVFLGGVVIHRGGLYGLRRSRRLGKAHEGVSVVTWNVMYDNEPEQVASGVSETMLKLNVDLVFLYEPVSAQLDAIEHSGALIKHHVRCVVPGDGDERHAGIAGYGGEHIESIDWVDCGGMGALRAVANLGGEKIVIWGYRPEAPTSEERKERWKHQLKRLEELLAKETLPICLMGDMNSSIWHVPYRNVLNKFNLKRASGLRGTWQHPQLGWRGRIDHIAVDDRLRSRGGGAIGSYGSDHKALYVEIGS